jgi:hypothetical protein
MTKIVCLCGSTRFEKEFHEANKRETLDGKIVLTVGFFGHSTGEVITPEQKYALDALHLTKINLAHEILVINPGGYIGDSTRNEIEHAARTAKKIRFLEDPGWLPQILIEKQKCRHIGYQVFSDELCPLCRETKGFLP